MKGRRYQEDNHEATTLCCCTCTRNLNTACNFNIHDTFAFMIFWITVEKRIMAIIPKQGNDLLHFSIILQKNEVRYIMKIVGINENQIMRSELITKFRI